MAKAGHKNSKKQPRSDLQLKFWQVADIHGLDNTATPFENYRVSSGLARSEIASRMEMSSSDYADFESGEIFPAPRDIIGFCKAVNCHPLDLYYPEIGPDTPLPRTIFHTLIQSVDDPSLTLHYRDRCWSRLEIEACRAMAQIGANKQSLKPLFLSLGLTPEHKGNLAPIANPALLPANPSFRNIMDISLIEYEAILEEQRSLQERIRDDYEDRYYINKTRMMKKANIIFGKDHADQAIEGLLNRMKNEENTEKLRKNFMDDPDIFCSTKAGSGSATNTDKNIFFRCVRRHMQIAPLCEGGELHEGLVAAKRSLDKFIGWRNRAKTAVLLDWYEDYAVIRDAYERHQDLQPPKVIHNRRIGPTPSI